MKGINSIKFAAFFFFVAMIVVNVSPAFAEDYWWSSNGGGTKWPSPQAGCDAAFVEFKASIPKGEFNRLTKDSETQWSCVFWNSSSHINITTYVFKRGGNGCTSPAVYNSDTGHCDLPSLDAGQVCDETKQADAMPKITSTAGECVMFSMADQAARCKYGSSQGTKFMDFWITFDSDGNPQSPPNPEKFGCKVDVLSVAQCKMPAPSCKDGICVEKQVAKCKVAASFTGEVAGNGGSLTIGNPQTGSEGVCPDGVDCTPPDEPQQKENKQCNYVYDEDGRKVCDSRQFQGDPGSMNCGEFNGGGYTCTAKVPTANGIDISTKIDTTPNSDGSSTSTKTDVAIKYNCPNGYSSCTVTNTTTTTTTHTNADGSIAGSSSTTVCSGAECGGSSGSGGGGNGGKGDDTTNCDPATDPKACEGGSTDGGGKKCDAPIQCDGDAVMCAILQQQHKDTCELMAEPSDEEKSKFEQDKAAEATKVDQLQEQLDDKASSLFSDFQAKATGNQYGGRCFDDVSFEFMGSTFTLPASQVCPYLALFRYAVVAMAYLAAARIVSRGI